MRRYVSNLSNSIKTQDKLVFVYEDKARFIFSCCQCVYVFYYKDTQRICTPVCQAKQVEHGIDRLKS